MYCLNLFRVCKTENLFAFSLHILRVCLSQKGVRIINFGNPNQKLLSSKNYTIKTQSKNKTAYNTGIFQTKHFALLNGFPLLTLLQLPQIVSLVEEQFWMHFYRPIQVPFHMIFLIKKAKINIFPLFLPVLSTTHSWSTVNAEMIYAPYFPL